MTALKTYWLEPEPITTLFGSSRAKRHMVRSQDLPKSLVDAILATEDHRFYSHHGVDSLRMIAAAIADLPLGQAASGWQHADHAARAKPFLDAAPHDPAEIGRNHFSP